MTHPDFSRRIDHSLLDPATSRAAVERAAKDALDHSLMSLRVVPVWASVAASVLRGGAVRTAVVVSYPNGGSKPLVKAIEASSAVKDGADEVEVVPHLPNLLRQDYAAIRAELLDVVRAVRRPPGDGGRRCRADGFTSCARRGKGGSRHRDGVPCDPRERVRYCHHRPRPAGFRGAPRGGNSRGPKTCRRADCSGRGFRPDPVASRRPFGCGRRLPGGNGPRAVVGGPASKRPVNQTFDGGPITYKY